MRTAATIVKRRFWNNMPTHFKIFLYKGPLVPNHSNQEFAYPLRGLERNKIKQELLRNTAVQVREEAIKNAFHDGNWQDIRSTDVYRKARSEALAQGDFHRND